MNFYERRADAKLLSALQLNGLVKRDVYNKVFMRDPEMADLDWFEEAKGRESSTSSETVEHYEEGSIFKSFGIATAAAGAGADAGKILVTLDAASHSADGKLSYPRVGDRIEFSASAHQYVVHKKNTTTPSGHVLTMAPVNSTKTIATPADLNGGRAFILGTLAASGAGSPTSRAGDLEKFTFSTQILREAYDVDGSFENTETEVMVKGPGGKEVPFYTVRGEATTADRFKAAIAISALVGQVSDDSLVDADGNPMRASEGLIPIIERRGVEATYASAPTVDDFDTLIKQLDARRACSEYMLRPDINLDLALDNMIKDELLHNGIRYEMIGGEEFARSAGFKTFAKGGYSFHKQRMKVFSHSELLGANPKYTDFSILLPLGFKKDAKSHKDIPQLSLKYKEGNGISRRYKVWEDGANANTPTNDKDYRRINYLTEFLVQVMGADDFAIFKKQ